MRNAIQMRALPESVMFPESDNASTIGIRSFDVIEKLVINLERCNLALVRKNAYEHPETAPVMLTNCILRSLELNTSISRKMVDLFIYYLKDVNHLVDQQEVSQQKIRDQKTLLTLAEYMQEVTSQLDAGKISKEKARGLIEGAAAILVQTEQCSAKIGKSLVHEFGKSKSLQSTGIESTLAKWKNSIRGS